MPRACPIGIYTSRHSPAPEERNVYRLASHYSLAPSGATSALAHMPLLTELEKMIHRMTINIALLTERENRYSAAGFSLLNLTYPCSARALPIFPNSLNAQFAT